MRLPVFVLNALPGAFSLRGWACRKDFV